MDWHTTPDATRFLAAAGDELRARPVENTLLLTIAEKVRVEKSTGGDAADAWFGWTDGPTPAAVVCTPPHPLVLGMVSPDAAAELADHLAVRGVALSGVNGEPAAAQEFARAWGARTGVAVAPGMRTRLYRLADLVPPRPAPPGRARRAMTADMDLLAPWVAAFAAELDDPIVDPVAMADERLRHGAFVLWEDAGEPVSLGGHGPVVAGMARVGPIYTPPRHRRRGYAAAVTAAATESAAAAGARDIVLFTDAANATSNGVYQRIGYVPVHERLVLTFTGPSAA